jgi:hypothetical protein
LHGAVLLPAHSRGTVMSGYKRWPPPLAVAGKKQWRSGLAWPVASAFLVAAVVLGCANGSADGRHQTAGNDELAILVTWHLNASRGYRFIDDEVALASPMAASGYMRGIEQPCFSSQNSTKGRNPCSIRSL